MKRLLLGLVAVGLVMLGTSQLSRADLLTIQISINGGAVQTFTCPGTGVGDANTCLANYSIGTTTSKFSVGVTGGSNLPGTAGVSTASQSDFVLRNSLSTNSYADITVIAQDFTQPVYPPQVNLSLTGAITQGTGTFHLTAGGGGNASDLLTIGTNAGPCNNVPPLPAGTTMSALGTCAGPLVSFNPTGMYSLITTAHVELNAGSSVTGSVQVNASSVPEPASMALFGSGLMGLAGLVRRKNRKK